MNKDDANQYLSQMEKLAGYDYDRYRIKSEDEEASKSGKYVTKLHLQSVNLADVYSTILSRPKQSKELNLNIIPTNTNNVSGKLTEKLGLFSFLVSF